MNCIKKILSLANEKNELNIVTNETDTFKNTIVKTKHIILVKLLFFPILNNNLFIDINNLEISRWYDPLIF